MSISFYLPYKKKLFSNNILTVQDILGVIPQIRQFTFAENDEKFNKENFYNKKINEFSELTLGIDLECSRGFDISFAKDINKKYAYRIRFLTPSTIKDWEIGLSFMKELAKRLNVDIFSEYGEKYNVDNIQDFNYKNDIMFGINSLLDVFDVQSSKSSPIMYQTLSGIFRTLYLNKDEVIKLLSSYDPCDEFSELFYRSQYVDAYEPKQTFYQREDGSMFGLYALIENTETIIPFKPTVDFTNNGILKDQVSEWKLRLMTVDDEYDLSTVEVLDVVDYAKFISNLPESKYRFIDSYYIEIQALSRDEMKEILSNF